MTATDPAPDCGICAWADRTGSWVDAPGHHRLTHCRECHVSWPRATRWQHCMTCHETFTTETAADVHRDGQHGRVEPCIPPGQCVTAKGRSRLRIVKRCLYAGKPLSVWGHIGNNPWSKAT